MTNKLTAEWDFARMAEQNHEALSGSSLAELSTTAFPRL